MGDGCSFQGGKSLLQSVVSTLILEPLKPFRYIFQGTSFFGIYVFSFNLWGCTTNDFKGNSLGRVTLPNYAEMH